MALARPRTGTVADISDGICAYIFGGLGNQLFLLAAAWAQAERLGCPLYVDTSSYRHPGATRASELDSINLPGTDITDRSPWATVRLLHGPPGLHTVVAGGQRLRIFTEQSFGYDPSINSLVPGTTITGFCQSPKYFSTVADPLAERLLSAELLPGEDEYLEEVVRDRRTSVHIRRGDYVTTDGGQHIAETEYFKRATSLYERLHPTTRYRVYTDSPETVEAELSGLSQLELSAPSSPMRSIAVLRAMACADGIVMSNSTFSWWAAWLIARADPDATVIAPRPWLGGGESAADLLLPDWITLDARA